MTTTFDQSMTNDESTKTTDVSPIEMLVGENKKFKDAEALAKGKLEADTFIEQLKGENAELRKELMSRPTSEDVLKLLREQTKPADSSRENTTPVLDEDTLSKLVESKLTSFEVKKKFDANELEADAKMKETYGDKAVEVLKSKAQELGVTVKYLHDTARSSPSAFFKLLGLNETKKYEGTKFEVSTKNTASEGFTSNASVKYGTKAYWTELRKKEPNKYFTPSVQQEVLKSKKDGTYDA